MKFLIQQNNEVNVAALLNAIRSSLGQSCELGFFSPEADMNQIIYGVKPDIILYFDTQFSMIQELISRLKCVKIEHATDVGTGMADYTFSLTNPGHENFFPATCNTFVLGNRQPAMKFISDLAFLGPPSRYAMEHLDPYVKLGSERSLRIYGQNQYFNWRYCGRIDDYEIGSVYASATCVPIFNRDGMYDARVLDCLYCDCIPVVEHHDMLVENFGDRINRVSFSGKEEFHQLVDDILADTDSFKHEVTAPLRKKVIEQYTWYDVCASIMKGVNLPQTASAILSAKRAQVR